MKLLSRRKFHTSYEAIVNEDTETLRLLTPREDRRPAIRYLGVKLVIETVDLEIAVNFVGHPYSLGSISSKYIECFTSFS